MISSFKAAGKLAWRLVTVMMLVWAVSLITSSRDELDQRLKVRAHLVKWPVHLLTTVIFILALSATTITLVLSSLFIYPPHLHLLCTFLPMVLLPPFTCSLPLSCAFSGRVPLITNGASAVLFIQHIVPMHNTMQWALKYTWPLTLIKIKL